MKEIENLEFFPGIKNINDDRNQIFAQRNIKVKTLTIRGGFYDALNISDSEIKNLIIDGNIITRQLDSIFYRNKINNITFKSNTTCVPSDFVTACNVKKINLGNIEIIGPNAFTDSRIDNIKWSNNLIVIHANAFSDSSLPSECNLPDSLRYIGAYSFYNAGLKEVNFGSNLQAIGLEAFAENNIQDVELPVSLMYIDDSVFSKLENLTIQPGTLKNYQSDIIYKANNVTYGYISKIPMSKEIIVDDTLYAILKPTDKKLSINESVKNIASYAFHMDINFDNYEFNEVNLKNVETLNPFSFYNGFECNNLILPDKIKEIPDACFDCSKIYNINLENIEKIGKFALASSNIKVANLNSLKELDIGAFYSSNLQTVTIPETVKKIPAYALYTPYLNDITLKNGLEEIGYKAIKIESKDEFELKLPKTLKTIKERGLDFVYSNKVTITLPSNIENIDKNFVYGNFVTVKVPVNVANKFNGFRNILNKFTQIKFYKPTLDELIEAGYSTSEINQIYKGNEER